MREREPLQDIHEMAQRMGRSGDRHSESVFELVEDLRKKEAERKARLQEEADRLKQPREPYWQRRKAQREARKFDYDKTLHPVLGHEASTVALAALKRGVRQDAFYKPRRFSTQVLGWYINSKLVSCEVEPNYYWAKDHVGGLYTPPEYFCKYRATILSNCGVILGVESDTIVNRDGDPEKHTYYPSYYCKPYKLSSSFFVPGEIREQLANFAVKHDLALDDTK